MSRELLHYLIEYVEVRVRYEAGLESELAVHEALTRLKEINDSEE